MENTEEKIEHKTEHKHDAAKTESDVKHEHKHEAPADAKVEEKKKVAKIEHVKKDEAVAISNGLPISLKQSKDMCRFIKNKKIDQAIAELERVMILKMPVPLRGEIPHRKGRIMAGRYPVNTSESFIKVLKSLRGNCIVNGLNMDRVRIVYASPNFAAIRAKSGGRRAKRVNLILKAREHVQKESKK